MIFIPVITELSLKRNNHGYQTQNENLYVFSVQTNTLIRIYSKLLYAWCVYIGLSKLIWIENEFNLPSEVV